MQNTGHTSKLNDIREYLRREVQPFSGATEHSDVLQEKIVKKSEGLFLYVNWLRQELQEGRLSLDCVDQFPRGLGGIYVNYFRRYFPDYNEYATSSRPALEAIFAAREPLDQRDLVVMFNCSVYQTEFIAARLGSLFPVINGAVRPFHQSLRDWIANPWRSGRYYLDLQSGERRLADFVWQQYKKGSRKMTRYCVIHAPAHLASCPMKTELMELPFGADWIEA